MAVVTRYINSAASAGGNGTTNATVGANRAYSSPAEWDAAEATNLVTDGDTHIVYDESTTTAHSALVNIGTDWTTGASNDITYEGNFEGNKWDTSLARFDIDDVYNGCVEIVTTHVTVRKMQMHNGDGAADNYMGFVYTCSADCDHTIDRCLVKGSIADDASSLSRGVRENVSGTGTNIFRVRNCIFYDFGFGLMCDYPPGTDTQWYVYNNTITECRYGFYTRDIDTIEMRNNILVNNSVSDYNDQTPTTTSNNITSDATSPDGASWRNLTVTFTDEANDDYSVGSGEDDVVDNGYDITGIFTESINGVTRDSTPDCGAHQLAAAVTGLIPTSKTISRAVQRVGHF